MENRLQNLIISAQLTPKEKEVADYVLENLQKCCFMTSTELAGELNVSYSSVIRLTKTLGFTGYPDFQNFLRETYAEQSRDVDTGILIPAERIEAIKKKEHKATVQDTVCAYTLSNIQSTIASNTEEQYRKASSILINSGVKYIFSSRGSTCVGEFLNTILRQTLPHVYNYGSHGRTCLTLPATWGKAMRRFLSPIPGIPG
ncbi:MurR/RpiR family transcriptional regulator [Ruminococcus sp. OF03-6AA]|nr:MurR/RpiR family transcriptional regulator [Ruminococcus sp. OF03-6AA]